MEEADLQKKYLEYQLLQGQLNQTQKQLQLLDDQLVEVIYTQQSLDELKGIKPGTEVLVPVISGIFATAKLGKVDELTVNVGAGTAVTKTIGSTKEMLAKQLLEIQKLRAQLAELAKQIEQQMLARGQEISGSMGE